MIDGLKPMIWPNSQEHKRITAKLTRKIFGKSYVGRSKWTKDMKTVMLHVYSHHQKVTCSWINRMLHLWTISSFSGYPVNTGGPMTSADGNSYRHGLDSMDFYSRRLIHYSCCERRSPSHRSWCWAHHDTILQSDQPKPGGKLIPLDHFHCEKGKALFLLEWILFLVMHITLLQKLLSMDVHNVLSTVRILHTLLLNKKLTS